METKLIGVLAALVLSIGVISTVYMQSAFAQPLICFANPSACDQFGTSSASDSSTNTQSATNTASADSAGSGNGNGNGNTGGSGDNGNSNGNALSSGASHQHISHETTAKVEQKLTCRNTQNNGVSSSTC